MLLEQAIELIKNEELNNPPLQKWADLGCGTGLFTSALANLLGKGSLIYAIDNNKFSMNKIPVNNNVVIEKLCRDIIEDNLPFNLNGILMANSFHYINDKKSFIRKTERNFILNPTFLIVEYDLDISNPWVPFPLSFNSLRLFFKNAGYTSIKKLNEHTSIYRRANIYSVLIKK